MRSFLSKFHDTLFKARSRELNLWNTRKMLSFGTYILKDPNMHSQGLDMAALNLEAWRVPPPYGTM